MGSALCSGAVGPGPAVNTHCMEIAGITRYIGASAGERRASVGLDLPLTHMPAGVVAVGWSLIE